MAKQQLPSSFLTQSSLEDHPIFTWLEKNSRIIVWAVLGITLLLGLWYRHASSKHSAAEQDYFQATNAIVAMKNPEKSQAALKELQAILNRRPELNAKYDGVLAQNLLMANNVSLASVYANKNFARIEKEISPLFLSYAKNSLTISENKSEEALANARNLKAEMMSLGKAGNEHLFGAELYLFNLIRIAMLEHKLNDKNAEAKSWEELLQISRLEYPLKFNSGEVQKALQHLNDQGVSLMDFIENVK